jgi:hypothetical protein
MNVKQLKGKPNYTKKKFSGYVLWKQSNGFHLRWMTRKGKKHSFQGTLTYQGKILITKKDNIQLEDKLAKAEKKTIKWDVKGQDQFVGFNFLTPKSFTLELQIDNKKIKPKEIYLGPGMENPEENPFLIDIPYRERVPNADLEPKPISQPESGPVTQPELEPISQPKLKPVTQPELEPISQPEPEPVTQPEPGPIYELEGEYFSPDQKINNWLTQLKEHRTAYEPETEPAYESEGEPVYESKPEPAYESKPESVYESKPEPAYESKPEPVYEPETEPTYESEGEPVYESKPEPAHESILDQTYESEGVSNLERETESGIEKLSVYKDLPILKPSSKKSEDMETPEKRIDNWLKQLKNHRKGL